MMDSIIIFGFFCAGFLLAVGLFSFWQNRIFKVELKKREDAMEHRVYELAILKELGERIGYSLDIQQIIDIISGSLHQFIDFNTVSYMLLGPDKIVFKVHIERSVHEGFIGEVRDRMLRSLSAILDKDFTKEQVQEVMSGAILVEDLEEPVRSFFNIPLVIGDKVEGVLTIADTRAGLYKEEEMTFLYKITRQASDAVLRLQEVVAGEERKFNAMVESMTEGVVMTDTDFRIMVVNPAAKKVIGYEDDGEVSIFSFIEKLEGTFDIRGKLEESIKLSKFMEVPEVLIGDRYFKILISPVKSTFGLSKGETVGGVVIFHDISRGKQLERVRDDFTSMMVHELRSPLDGIKKLLEVMMGGGTMEDEEKYKEYLGLMFEGSSDMLNLVNDLLDIAKVEAGKFEIFSEPSDIRKIIENRIAFFETLAKSSEITLGIQIDPVISEKAEVNLDARRISQVLNNLISNSMKFTKAGGKITVQALMHSQGQDLAREAKKAGMEWIFPKDEKDRSGMPDSLVVAVTDTGIGMSEAQVAQLFNKFKQFKASATSKRKGTGLGLAIVKGIVEAHKGEISVGTEEGVGSTFFFTIPTGSDKDEKKG